jgi:hypothetical protein
VDFIFFFPNSDEKMRRLPFRKKERCEERSDTKQL